MGKENIRDFDIDKPRYNLDTYAGRCKHFFVVVNPLNLLVTNATLDRSKEIVRRQRAREPQEGVETIEELVRAKVIYDSAFHPETGFKQILIGRMSAQVPVNMAITACMTYFYRTNAAIIFWQWINQSFNAIVNYTNRGGGSPITHAQILGCYFGATSSAVIVSLFLKRLAQRAPPVAGRLVPFVGCGAANCINLPIMRASELRDGTAIYDENGTKVGSSRKAAVKGIAQVIFSRVCMPIGGMVAVPIFSDYLTRTGTVLKYMFPMELGLNGTCLLFTTPMCCALFKQYQEFPFHKLESDVQEEIKRKYGKAPKVVYFNKGL